MLISTYIYYIQFMHIIIYHNNYPIFLCDDIDDHAILSYSKHQHTFLIENPSNKDFSAMLQAAEQPNFYAGIFMQNNLSTLKNNYWHFFKVILAGGGVVYNEHNEILLIYRIGFWDLPKGKLDKGETLKQCAVREVQEETGLTKISVQEKIITTYHTYQEKGKYILKESHWFKMKVDNNPILIPQIEEQIEIAKWVSQEDVKKYMPQMYSSIRDVLSTCIPY